MKILIVDDQWENRKLLRAQLESEENEVVEAEDGVEALRILETLPMEAVVSDVLMPKMDGFRLCHQVRTRANLAELPFIIYTSTYDSPSDQRLGQSVGADGYIVRPAAVELILDAIHKAKSRLAARPAPASEVGPEHMLEHYSATLVSKLEQKNLELAQTNGELRVVRDQLQRLLQHSPVVIYALTIENRRWVPRFVSANIKRMLGYEPEEITYEWWNDHVHPEDRQRELTDASEIGADRDRVTQCRVRDINGQFLWIENTCRVLRDSAGDPVEIAGVWTDITERKLSEARLREQARLLDIASDAIFVQDMDGRIQYWSQGAERIFGWQADEVKGRRQDEFLQKDDLFLWQRNQDLLRHGEWSGECRKCTKSGKELDVMSRWTLLRGEDGQPKAVLSINSDITEKKKMEARILRVQRLESIGTLASGIAHDLNNVLSPIMLSLPLLQQRIQDDIGRELIQDLAQNAMRGAAIIKQVLAYGRGMNGERVPVNMCLLAKEIQRIITETFPRSIQFKLQCDPEIWIVTGDPTQLHQVLLNLSINARDAMPNGGHLGFKLANVTVEANYIALNSEIRPGHYVRIEVSDDGIGIPAGIRDRIFDPFFTTKELGRGTGLGLSTVLAILKSHEGFAKVYSEEGKGSVFKVYLPASPSTKPPPPSINPPQLIRGRGEGILLVDDEELILTVAQKNLERFGYRVFVASEGASGVALYAQHHREIAAVVTDMVMPVLDGAAMITALKKINPEVKIITTSGFAAESGAIKTIESGVQMHLQKPYNTEALLQALHKVLHPS